MGSFAISTFPYDCVVLIESPDPANSSEYIQGSGMVIGPHTILTASHVVYDISAQMTDQSVHLYPGWSGADPALGTGFISTSYNDHFHIIGTAGSNALTEAQSANDFAVIDTSYAFSSWMGMSGNYQGGTVNLTGYPGSAGGQQTTNVGTVSANPFYSVLNYDSLTSSAGDSGGPIWADLNGSDDVVGIASTGGWACQLTSSDISQIDSWVRQDGYGNVVPLALRNIADSNNIALSGDVRGPYNFIDLLNLEASYGDLINAFGANQNEMQGWYNSSEPSEKRPDTFDGLDYVASYSDLIAAFDNAGSQQAMLDDGASHYINNGAYEGRTISFNALDYIASYGDLIKAFGVNGDEGAYHYIEDGVKEGRTTTFDGLDYIASYADLIKAFGANEQAGAAHFIQNGFNEGRKTTFDGLDYIASYGDLIAAFKNAGSQQAVLDAGATHYIDNGVNEGRTTSFNGLDYIASYSDLIKTIGVNADAGAYSYIETGFSAGRRATFDGLDYIASYSDLIKALGANEQAGAVHYIENGFNEGRKTTFDGLDYIAGYADLMKAYGANNDAGATHYIDFGLSEGRSANPFNVAAYESAHSDLIGKYATNDAFLTAYINTYVTTGKFLT